MGVETGARVRAIVKARAGTGTGTKETAAAAERRGFKSRQHQDLNQKEFLLHPSIGYTFASVVVVVILAVAMKTNAANRVASTVLNS